MLSGIGAGWLNLASLLFGVLAWVLPAINLGRRHVREEVDKSWALVIITSFSACGIALILQVFYQAHLVDIEDWSALMDTTRAVGQIGAFLLLVTIILNVLSLRKRRHPLAEMPITGNL